MNSREQSHQEMQEGDPKSDNKLINKASSSSSRSQWGGFRNPRIVRVSRSFGGKDRHSKVCTVRGLRDRRIRLSVPTAVQLYGLQDKLGLSQPSKVVDWLLEATKNDIDKLPPLQIPQGSLGQFFSPSSSSSSVPCFFNQNSSSYLKEGIKINGNDDQNMMDNRSKYGIPQGEKEKWIASNVQENLEANYNASQITAQNFFPILNQSSFPSLFTSSLPYNHHPYYQLEANYSNLSLSQYGSNNTFPNQVENQLYIYPSTTSTTTNNPQLSTFTTMENSSSHDPNRQINHFQFLNSTSQQHLLPNPLIPTLHFIKNLDPQESDKNQGGCGS